MPSGQNYEPVLSGKWTDNQFLASIQANLIAYAQSIGITMPSGQNYSPVNSGKWTDNQFLASIQNLMVLLANGGGGGGGGSGTLVRAGSVALVNGQTDGYSASFGVTFSSVPVLSFAPIKSATGSANISVTGYTVTTTGFTFDLQGDPGAGAFLNYHAALASP